MLEYGRWMMGACFAVIGLLGLFLSSRAADETMYWLGLGLFVAAVLFNFLQIKQAYDDRA